MLGLGLSVWKVLSVLVIDVRCYIVLHYYILLYTIIHIIYYTLLYLILYSSFYSFPIYLLFLLSFPLQISPSLPSFLISQSIPPFPILFSFPNIPFPSLLLSLPSSHPNIHSIRVGTWICLLIFQTHPRII